MELGSNGEVILTSPVEKNLGGRAAQRLNNDELYVEIVSHTEDTPLSLSPEAGGEVIQGLKNLIKDPNYPAFLQARARGMLSDFEKLSKS